MAIYHLHVSTGSRQRGQSAAAKSEYLGRRGRYRRDADQVRHVESAHMPAWAQGGRGADRAARYWRAADAGERANGSLYREVEVALPRELDDDQQLQLARAFAAELADQGEAGAMPYTMAIHDGVHGDTPHAHIVLSERIHDGLERDPQTWFRRAATGATAAAAGGARKARLGSSRAWLEQTRERWAALANDALESARSEARIDHRSYADRGIAQAPEPKVGVSAGEREIEKREKLRAAVAAANAGDPRALQQAHDNTRQRGLERTLIGRAVLRAQDQYQRAQAMIRERVAAGSGAIMDALRASAPRADDDAAHDDGREDPRADDDARDDDDAEWHPSM